MIKKISLVILGNLLIGLGVGFFVYLNLGIDPSTTFFTGLNNQLQIGLGNCITIGSSLLFIPMFLKERSTIHFGTFVNMFGIGYMVQYASQFFISVLPEYTLLVRLSIMPLVLLVICIGVGLYLSCDMGQAPWDALGHLVNKQFPSISYAKARMAQEILALTLGFLMGAPLGIASIILAFCLGPGIQYFTKQFRTLLFSAKN